MESRSSARSIESGSPIESYLATLKMRKQEVESEESGCFQLLSLANVTPTHPLDALSLHRFSVRPVGCDGLPSTVVHNGSWTSTASSSHEPSF